MAGSGRHSLTNCLALYVKGQCLEIFASGFFHEPHWYADPDSAFYLIADPYSDPDPESQTNPDPCGSGFRSGSLSDVKATKKSKSLFFYMKICIHKVGKR